MATCICTQTIVRKYDASGVEHDTEHGIRIDKLAYTVLEVKLSKRNYDHQDGCPMLLEPVKLINLREFLKDTSHKGNGTYKGAFAFTITKSPHDLLEIDDMLEAVRKIMSQKSCPVARYAWYLEDKGKDDNGIPLHPHIHGMYETLTHGRIEKKHWKRAWPIWDESTKMGQGFRGGYHRPVRVEESYDQYMKKDNGVGGQYDPTKI